MYQYPFSRHFISPTFLFSVSFPYWAKLRIIIGREKVPSSLLFWPKNDWRKTNLLPCGQTALATVWKVLSRHGTCQNLLIVPHFVLYNVCGPFYLSNEAATILIIHHTKATFFFTFQNGNDSDTAYKHLAYVQKKSNVYFLLFTNIRQLYCVNISWSKKMIGSQEPSMSRGLYECNPLKDMN